MPTVQLAVRRREPELMDQPGLEPNRHREALRSLALINWFSGTLSSFTWRIRPLAKKHPVRVLDLACGGGDLAIGIWRWAHRRRLPVDVSGCDVSETALGFARVRAAGTGVRFFRHDLLADPFPTGFDIVTCSLFLHHLDENPIVDLFRGVRESGASLFLASDLSRSRSGYWLAWGVTRLLSRSAIVHTDGPLSVRAAFTVEEMSSLAGRGFRNGFAIRPCWPRRFLLRWERPA